MCAYNILTRSRKIIGIRSPYENAGSSIPAFYEDISVDTILDSLTNALGYNVESWDGYIVALAKKFRATIYAVDLKLM